MMNIRNQVAVYRNLCNALSAVEHSVKAAWIVMGDNCEYWVCSPAIAARLEKMGFEIL